MSKAAAPSSSTPPVDAAEVRQSIAGKHVCPFCGVLRSDPNQPCPRCTLDDTAATRQATKQRIGPWFVLQARNPSAPGMKLATLQSLVRRGHLTPRSVVRGPTTEQMWAFVASVRGLSREFGLCYHCGEAIDPSAANCPHCNRGQELPPDPDAMMETAAPAAVPPPAPLFAPPPAPVPPADFLSTTPLRTDTGMDGGTSLDLQVDSLFPIGEARPPTTSLAPPKPVRPAVQRAPTPAKEEAILTARELAAAFQLDFKPQNARNNGSARRRPVRTLAGLLLIALIAATVVLGLRSDWRRAAFGWTLERWGMLAASLEQPAKPAAGPGGTPGTTLISGSTPSGQTNPAATGTTGTGTTPAGTTPTGMTPTGMTPPGSAANVPPPAPREPAKVAPPTAVPPAPVAKVEPKPTPPATPPAPTPVVVAPPAAPPPAAVPDDLTIEQATTVAVNLRLRAIDAQAKGDWTTALGCYEQIQKLPRDAWPADLPMRLEVARRHVGN